MQLPDFSNFCVYICRTKGFDMAKNYFDRYVWLIELINRHGYIKYEDISRAWAFSPLNSAGSASIQQSELPPRTFYNHIEAIFDTFHIEIKCNRDKGYYIANSEDLDADGVRNWLLQSLSVNNMLNETKDMRDRILFEKIPSSQKWLPVIVNAMRDGKVIEMTYQSFWRDEPNTYTAKPYCLKLFKQRWYVLAKSEGKKEPRVYSLDERMLNVVQTDKSYKLPADFNAEKFFSDYFGIIADPDYEAEEVKIRVRKDQEKYFDTLPLHDSQRKIDEESDDDYTVYQYCLATTFDFKQEILSHGPSVTVLSPEHFRQEVMTDIKNMISNY